ncbi:MAG: hypothetical protein NVSMB1_05920 [Polyangiales bacterium]
MSARIAVYPKTQADERSSARRKKSVTLETLLDDCFANNASFGAAAPTRDASQAFLRRALHAPLADLFARPSKHIRGRLVRLSWDLAGGHGTVPPELPLLVELVHAGSLVVDDIEDDAIDRRGAPALHRQHGLPIALNAGNWLYFLPLTLIERLPLSASTQLAIHRSFSSTLLRCHQGQALDLTVRASEVARSDVRSVVEATMRAKTGALMELAAYVGALGAGATGTPLRAIAEFGCELGVGLQMLDDLGSVASSTRRSKGLEDVGKSRLTYPWAYLADRLDDPHFSDLQTMAREVENGRSPPGPLLDHLRRSIDVGARVQARAHLHSTFEKLRRAIGARPSLSALQTEVDRVERSYD